MESFSELSKRGQVARIRRMAHSILSHYTLDRPRLALIAHSFNTTFCVQSDDGEVATRPQDYQANRYLLRVHRQGFHGAGEQTRRVVQSEMRWLAALRQDCGLVVPEPVLTREGKYTAIGEVEGVSQPRVCSLLRWVKGRSCAASPKAVHFYRLGALTAQLHNHASGWSIPVGFERPRWNWDALFGDAIQFTRLSAAEAWALVPAAYRPTLERAAGALQQAMDELGQEPEVWGLIHADLHLENVIFAGEEARPIDFDDCGHGHWVYDIAVALWEQRLHAQWPAFRDAFFEGYAAYRLLPEEQLRYLDIFIAGREATIALGVAADTQEFPRYRKYLDENMRGAAEFIQTVENSGLRQIRSPR